MCDLIEVNDFYNNRGNFRDRHTVDTLTTSVATKQLTILKPRLNKQTEAAKKQRWINARVRDVICIRESAWIKFKLDKSRCFSFEQTRR